MAYIFVSLCVIATKQVVWLCVVAFLSVDNLTFKSLSFVVFLAYKLRKKRRQQKQTKLSSDFIWFRLAVGHRNLSQCKCAQSIYKNVWKWGFALDFYWIFVCVCNYAMSLKKLIFFWYCYFNGHTSSFDHFSIIISLSDRLLHSYASAQKQA